jgi:hypothetical protein
MFGGWLVLTVAAFFGSSAVGAARWQLALAGVLSLLVPVASAFNGAAPWVSVANGWWGILTIDVGFLLMGLALLWTAARLGPGALNDDTGSAGDRAAEQDPEQPSVAMG